VHKPDFPGIRPLRMGADVPVEFEITRLRVLIANERLEHLLLLTDVVTLLGHEVIAKEIEVSDVASATARELPDVAFVGLGVSSSHALDLIGQIVHEAACPVIALLSVKDHEYVREAAKRGIFASVFHEDPDELRDAIEISLRRFADYHKLQQAFVRRATIEQAKGILMSRNGLTADQAFANLREYSGRTSTRIVDVAKAVIESHGLLLPGSPGSELPPLTPV
jgi:two-component system, response regulator / RNA-binding antiterminator